ncbi:MAG: carbohydrate ABC transporter permease [Trueperaceae bacterium]|nr:MAG: carbohydrate ABC transporter permease [Trueperaceae bacterium]
MSLRRLSTTTLIQLLLIFNTVMVLYPIWVMSLSSFKSTREIFRNPFGLPESFNLDNFIKIWQQTNFPLYFRNSVVVTSGSIVLILILGIMAAYALGRYQFRGNELLYLFFLSGLMLPLRLALIPLFIELKAFGLINSHLGLIFIYAAQGLPSAVFIMTGFLRTLPSDLENAARIDGASELQILLRVMLPLTRPALVIVSIYNLVPVWNDFFFPLVFIQSENLKTLPLGLTVFMGQYSTDWAVLFAGLTAAAIPVIVLYVILSRQFIAGLTAGALK